MPSLALASRVTRVTPSMTLAIAAKAKAMKADGLSVCSFSAGEPDFDTPGHVRESTVFALERGATQYTSNLGYLELRRALARYVGKTFGADYIPDSEILIPVGVCEDLDRAWRAL